MTVRIRPKVGLKWREKEDAAGNGGCVRIRPKVGLKSNVKLKVVRRRVVSESDLR